MFGPAEVLLVNDASPEAAADAFDAAERDYRLHVVETIPAAVELAAEADLDCVVSEFEVPDSTGREFRGGFRLQSALDGDVPFVLFSTRLNEDIASEAIDAGVAGYIRRSAGYDRLVWRVGRIVDARQAERRAARRARIVDVVRDVNRALVRSPDRETLETGVTERLTHHEAYAMAAFCRPDDDDGFAWHDTATVAEAVPAPGAFGVVDRALSSGSFRTADVSATSWATDCDVEAVAVAPVGFEDTVYGGLVVFSTRPFDDAERSLLADLGETVGHARDALDLATSLRQRERELAEYNRHLEKFVDIVSHDLRNPLSVARGNVELALEHDAGDLEATSRALDRMDELLGDMLTIARQRSASVDSTSLSLASTAERAWESVDTSTATLRVDADATVEADESRLCQLFENLYRNAVEHAGESVTVAVGPLADGPGFYVADDGPGIADTDVFDPGYTTKADGTGLGLDIVTDVVETHGWTVALAESEAGGARFEFRTESGTHD